MENLEDSSSTMLSLPTSNATEQQSAAVANPVQQQVNLPSTTPMLGSDQLASTQLNKPTGYAVNNPYTATYPMNYGNYQQNFSQAGSYGQSAQGYSPLSMGYATSATGTPSYPHSTAYPQTPALAQQPTGTTTSAQSNPTSPSQLSSHAGYNAYPYSTSTLANYAQSNYPVSSQYSQTSSHLASHPTYQPMSQPAYQPPSGQSLMTQMNNNAGMAIPKATTPRAAPAKRRRQSEDAPKPTPKASNENAGSNNWERGQYQPTVQRKRARKNYDDDEIDDDDLIDDFDDEDDDMMQRTERKSSRERKPSLKGSEKEKKTPTTSPRVTPKKKEKVVEEEPEEEIEEQGNQEVELEFPEDSLIETDEENHSKKYSKIIFNGTTYNVGDTIAFWPETKKGRPPMGTIKSFSTDGENNTVECCWFYRVEETNLKGKRRQKIGPREVFLSDHTDPNACESIWKKVTIKSRYEVPDIDEYVKEPDCYFYSSKYNHLELNFEDL